MFIPLSLMSLYLAQLRPGRTPAQCHRKLDAHPFGEALYYRQERRWSRRHCKTRHSDHAISKPKCRRLQAQQCPCWRDTPRRVWSTLEVV